MGGWRATLPYENKCTFPMFVQPEADLNAKELNIDGGRIFFRTHVVEKNYVCFESTYKEGHFLVADKDKVVRLMKTNTEDIKTHFRLRQH
jgi:hypothetical protein